MPYGNLMITNSIKLTLLQVLTTTLAIAEPLIQPGDHVAIVGNTFADQLRCYGYFETRLVQQCPGISLRNLGWAGDTVTVGERPTNFPKEDETLRAHKTDVLLLCFGMGEALAGESGLAEFNQGLKERIQHYRAQQYNGSTAPRLILVSPIRGQDLGPLTPRFTEQANTRASITLLMQHQAKEAGIGFMDLFSAPMPEGKWTTNGIHLNDAGYRWISRIMMDQLFPDQPWQPSGFAGDWMQQPDLTDAYYALYIDDRRVTSAPQTAWNRGLSLSLPPDPKVETLRAAIIEKNAQFTYSWKALNQVHIVGERKNSNSGRALPEEVVAFHQLTIDHEQALQKLVPDARNRSVKLLPDPERKQP
ncbi:MAG: lysophospholipase L1-like esterase [Candidatus Omnitrophota bacterium]|jgi:lysophospholipase L1-like esterase